MEFKEIEIIDKPLFDRYLAQYPLEISEVTFTNLFMWRKHFMFRFAEIDEHLCVISEFINAGPYCLPPIGNCSVNSLQSIVTCLYDYFSEKNWKLIFKKVPSVIRDNLVQVRLNGSGPTHEHDRDNDDYVYSAQDLIHLKGKKYDGKRNHINKFKKTYEYEYIPFNNKLIPEAVRIMDEWCAFKNCDCENGDNCEKIANLELLNNYDMLNCKGAFVKVDGNFEAFTIGEMLNNDTAVIHIEKAKFTINGLYTFINQQFCEHEWQEAKYINREQDLGQEGLRKAKLSYNPVKIIDKYVISFV